jgi:hypothetical protein
VTTARPTRRRRAEEAVAAEPPVDPAEVGANELGVVPVLMYHQLREDGGSVYDMTEEEYRQELEWLFDNGYRPITTAQLARGEIDVPAGTKPVVLTYDDSTASQAQLTADGELDPATSLGILVEIAASATTTSSRAPRSTSSPARCSGAPPPASRCSRCCTATAWRSATTPTPTRTSQPVRTPRSRTSWPPTSRRHRTWCRTPRW